MTKGTVSTIVMKRYDLYKTSFKCSWIAAIKALITGKLTIQWLVSPDKKDKTLKLSGEKVNYE